MQSEGPLDEATKHARNCERVTDWQRTQQAKGLCRQCGLKIEPASKSRCPACLEQCRRYERGRRGITTAGRRRRGRPLIGDFGERRRAFEQEERRRAWRRERQAERRRQRWRQRYR